MADKTMRFRTDDGDDIAVVFSGENITEGNLIGGADPVRIQVEGNGRDFVPVKYATATITCMTDGVELQELYTTDIDITVRVTNETTGDILFLGAVTPNTFQQPISGCNDEVAIECVDLLGAAKYMPYERKQDSDMTYGTKTFKALTIAETVLHIADMLGVSKVSLADHITIQPRHGEFSTSEYEKMTIAEQWFYSDITPERIVDEAGERISYEPLAMTCYEALEMLGRSLYSTWMLIGDTMILHDYLTQRCGSVKYKELSSAGVSGHAILLPQAIEEDSFATGGSQVNILPHYTRFSIEHKSAEEVNVFPEIFRHNLYIPRAKSVSSSSEEDVEKRYVRIIDTGAMMPMSITNPDLQYYMLATAEIQRPEIAKRDKTDYWRNIGFDDNWDMNFYMRDKDQSSTVTTSLLDIDLPYRMAIVARYNYWLRLRLEIGFDGTDRVFPEPEESGDRLLHIQLISGGRYYYNEVTEQWTETAHDIILVVPGGDAWRKDFYFKNASYTVAATDALAFSPPSGRIQLRIVPGNNENWRNAWVRQFSLSIVEPHHIRATNSIDPLPKREYAGTWSRDSELDTVNFPIELEPTLAEKCFGTLIDGIEYCGALDLDSDTSRYAAEFRFDTANGERVRMLKRIELLANADDNCEYVLPLHDDHNRLAVNSAFTCTDLWQGVKAVVGLEKNVISNIITVTVN